MTNSDWQEQARGNAERLKQELDSLGKDHGQQTGRTNYGKFWAHTKRISELFKTLKPLDHKERHTLWTRFNVIRDEARQDAERSQKHSKEKREIIERKFKDAHYQISAARNLSELFEPQTTIDTAFSWMRDGWDAFNMPTQLFNELANDKGRLSKEDRDACWSTFHEVKRELIEKRRWFSDLRYRELETEALDAISEAGGDDPYGALNHVKAIQRALRETPMNQYQREVVRERLDQAWSTAVAAIKKRKEGGVARQAEWAGRMNDRISHLESIRDGKIEFIGRLEQEIEELKEKADSARTQDFADRVAEWIEEKRLKIEGVKDSVRDISEKMREMQDRLR